MTYLGTVQNGVVVLTGGEVLPEGAVVHVSLPMPDAEFIEGKSVGQMLVELAEWAETQPCDLPEDLAINHDHYLYGVAKRE